MHQIDMIAEELYESMARGDKTRELCLRAARQADEDPAFIPAEPLTEYERDALVAVFRRMMEAIREL